MEFSAEIFIGSRDFATVDTVNAGLYIVFEKLNNRQDKQ